MVTKSTSRTAVWHQKFRARKWAFIILSGIYVGCLCVGGLLRSDLLSHEDKLSSKTNAGVKPNQRFKRAASPQHTVLNEDEQDVKNCTPRALEEFPEDFFTLEQTQDGAMAVHIAIALYMFGALAIICDDYFVASLEVICDRLHLQEDVAGATFMAAGSSAPEFFTSVIGVFIAKSDVGVGTIVGSAVFNILFIIGVCAIFAGMIVKLTWYPMTRDCLFYVISIAALVIIIDDEHVYWYEATVLVVLYFIYILVMYFNRPIEKKCLELASRLKQRLKKTESFAKGLESEEKQPLSDNTPSTGTYTESIDQNLKPQSEPSKETTFADDESISRRGSLEELDGNFSSPWDYPDSLALKIYWFTMLPIKLLLFITIPDCRRPGILRRLYAFTFTMSIVWIAACSYLMVWMVTVVGDALEIPDTVLGLTILAAGTSVPDCLSSIFVARDGYGDMAVSNSIGSNVFDILICLGLPWLLATTIIHKGDPLIINSGGIGYSALILLSTVVFMLMAINLAKWKLTKPFGFMCLFAYVVVITVSCLFELNVFGDFVLPSCDRES